jgi:hypothetical protein
MNRFLSLRRISPALVALGLLGLALPAAADDPLPFRGRANEVVTDAQPIADGLLLLTVTATGEATYLGQFTGTETVVLDLANGRFAGTRVFIAANGDRLYAAVQGGFTSATTAEGTFTFTGGTGRFCDASGKADFEVVTPDGIQIALAFTGTIDF